jgi:predicted N-acetyltransferase YhbS
MPAIRQMLTGDMDFAVAQSAREGWATARSLFETYLEHDPQGAFVAQDGDQLVGMITTTRYRESGWIGNLIVVPEQRSRGLGRRLMNRALHHLQSEGIRTIRLDGDPPGIPLYRSLGFVDEVESCRFARQPGGTLPLEDGRVLPLERNQLDEILHLDQEAFGDDRSRLMTLLHKRACSALLFRRQGALAGYLLMEPTDRCHRLGPGVATDEEAARVLITAGLNRFPSCICSLGIPALNSSGQAVLRSLGFLPTPSSIRMIRGPVRAFGRPELVFAIAGGAVG